MNQDGFLEELMSRRAMAVLEQENLRFPVEHAGDSNRQLITYLQRCAREIGHSPNSCEVIGGLYIAARFGGWSKALIRAGLPQPQPAPRWERRFIVRRERERQRELFLADSKKNEGWGRKGS